MVISSSIAKLHSKKLYWSMTKNFQINFYLHSIILYQHEKTHAEWPCNSWYIADLRILKFDWLGALHAKNQTDLSILTWDILDSGILQSDRTKAFLSTPNQIFSNQFLSSFNLSHLAYKKSCRLTLILLRYSWFDKIKIRLAENILNHVQLKIYKPAFTFL